MFGHRPMRRRSRHECHFVTGSHVPIGEEHLMSQSFHVGTTSSAHRRRTDLMPTLTVTPGTGVGTRTPSRTGGDRSGSSTPGHKMLRSATTGRIQSMSRLDLLARPRVLVLPHASSTTIASVPSPTRNRSNLRGSSNLKSDGSSPVKSVSMVQLNGPTTRRLNEHPSGERKVIRQKPTVGNNGLSTPQQRSPSAMSTEAGSSGVRLRNITQPRRPRPISIATTGVMSTSMFERGSKSTLNGPQTPGHTSSGLKITTSDVRRPRNRAATTDDEDTVSNGSGTSAAHRVRKTPAQVKAESALRKSKKSQSSGTPTHQPSTPEKSSKPITSTPKESTPKETTPKESTPKETTPKESTPKESTPKESTPAADEPSEPKITREVTPDIISSSPVRESSEIEGANEFNQEQNEKEQEISEQQIEQIPSRESDEESKKPETELESDHNNTSEKKIINSEEEARARLAEKRRQVKEQKEREAEMERQRLLAIQREEEERREREEEEERLAQEEADRIAEEARRIENERLQRAIEEQERKEREQKEKEEQLRKEKEESERRAAEEAEKKRIELEEKLRKEEEDRLARKKRIDEIMARTRGAKTSTVTQPTIVNNAKDSPTENNVMKSDSNVDPTKPDLLGDISEKPARIVGYNSTNEIEKGLLDMQLSAKYENEKNNQLNSSNASNSFSNDAFNFKQPDSKASLGDNGHEDVEQIPDFSPTNGHKEADEVPAPIMAFENNPVVVVSPSDLLS